MLDREGNRIDRRNPQDIFVPLYNKQIPPGAGQVVHFALEVPRDIDGPDHPRGQGQLSQVRPQVHGLRLRAEAGAQAPRGRDGQRLRPASGRRGTGRRQRAVADQAGMATMERLRHRPAARGEHQGGTEGRAEAGRGGLPQGGPARPGPMAGSTWPAFISERGGFPTPWRPWRKPPRTASPPHPGSSTGSPARSILRTGCSKRPSRATRRS